MQFSTTILTSILLASASGMAIPTGRGVDATAVSLALKTSASESVAVPNKYIVVMKPGLSEKAFESHKILITKKQSAVKGAHLKAFSKNSGIVLEFDVDGKIHGYTGYFAPETVEELKKLKDVEIIEPDSYVKLDAIATQRRAPWGLARISTRESLNGATTGDYIYDKEGGAGVTAYIIDSGINLRHKEFEGRAIWGTNVQSDEEDKDYVGHGTHCAGIVGGKTFGVAKKVNLVAVQALDRFGYGTVFDFIEAVQWSAKDAASRKRKPGFKGAVANISWGTLKSEALNMVVDSASDSLIITVSAGNEDKDACGKSPASAKGAITVGAIDNKDVKAKFSNYGKCVDIFAPGVDIPSAWIGSDSATRIDSGTSMATPHVSGLIAYFLSLQPASGSAFSSHTLTTAQMKRALTAFGTRNTVSKKGWRSPNVIAYNGAGRDLSQFYAATSERSSRGFFGK